MIHRRRMLCGGLGAWLAGPAAAQVPDWSLRAQQRLRGAGEAAMSARAALLRDGETRLAAGDAAGAEALFDRAAAMLHAADTEIGLVRCYVQQGQFRRALAFCAHTAGVHRDVVAAAALYVWLLHLGGQAAVARQRLRDAVQLYPGEPLLAALQAQLEAPWPRADGPLRALPARLAPYADAAVPQDVRVVGTATRVEDGRWALAPAAPLAGHRRCWLRDGCGHGTEAEVAAVDAEAGIAWLEPRRAWPPRVDAAVPDRPAVAGRPAWSAEFPARDGAEPDWPVLLGGFLGPQRSDPLRRPLGLGLPAGPRGGPVLDESGRLAGLAVPGPAGDRLIELVALRTRGPWARKEGAAGTQALAPAAVAPDAAYETALRLSLQLMLPA